MWWKLERNWGRIVPAEVVKETEHRVTVKEGAATSTYAKTSDYHSFHPTWEGAHAEAVKIAENAVESLRRRLEQAKGKLGQIKGMKKEGNNACV